MKKSPSILILCRYLSLGIVLCFFLAGCNKKTELYGPDKEIIQDKTKTQIILIGPPGVGKGTLGAALADYYELPYISSGQIIRDIKNDPTDRNYHVIVPYLKSSLLVPDSVVNDLVIDRIKDEDCEDGFILEGYPRTLTQAVVLDKELKALNANQSNIGGAPTVNSKIVVLQISDEKELINRIKKRAMCAKCNTGVVDVLKNPGLCKGCRGDEVVRDDDTEDIARKRLKIYAEETKPIISYYGPSRVVIINAMQIPSAVFKEVVDKIDAK